MKYSEQELWQFIQQHPDYSNYNGDNHDLRDWKKENAGMSINLDKGKWYDHNAGKGGGLFELAKSLNVLPEKEKKFPSPNEIWKKSEVPNHPDSRSFQLAKSYFTKYRKIPLE